MRLRKTTAFSPFRPRSDLLFAPRLASTRQRLFDPSTADEIAGTDLRQFVIDLQLRGQLEDELAAARLAIEELKRNASPPCTIRNHAAILQATAELFPAAQVTVEVESDPEGGDEEFFAVCVATPGEVNDLVARHGKWHSRKREIAPETASFYRLLLDIQ